MVKAHPYYWRWTLYAIINISILRVATSIELRYPRPYRSHVL